MGVTMQPLPRNHPSPTLRAFGPQIAPPDDFPAHAGRTSLHQPDIPSLGRLQVIHAELRQEPVVPTLQHLDHQPVLAMGNVQRRPIRHRVGAHRQAVAHAPNSFR